jgi:tRNA pseudouridine55 synthase
MTRRRGDPVNGWVIVDKPAGMTSAQVVAAVRRIMRAAKAGHAGTLDPLATGVLPVALGEATKTVSYVMDGAKEYSFTVRWGEARETDDGEGAVTATSPVRPDRAAIEAALPAFTGQIMQAPPAYSAVKIDGRRAYALARAALPVAPSPRPVRIDALQLVETSDPDHAVFAVRCGKGAYVRSLARDLAVRLGTVGHVAALRRTRVGPFGENRAISMDKLAALGHSSAPVECLVPVATALDDIPALALTAAQAAHLKQGRAVRVTGTSGRTFADIGNLAEGHVLCAMADGQPVALARFEAGEIRPLRVLNL